ncbi:MAG: efflux RND transporter periplasmic adaptor subunit [Bacteroidales bacterium]|nr:efflux RND transporter periplasmic adaptor subunit [Bacteroidales bacterium]
MKKHILLLTALCSILIGCCRQSSGQDPEHSEEQHSHDGEIVISEERQAALGIRTDTVVLGTFSEVIRTSGQIVPSSGDEMTVVAKSDGIVRLSGLSEGSSVGKGARIAIISSSEIGSGDRLAKARVAYETTKREYERDLQLSKDNIVSETHLDQSRLEYEFAKAEYEALSSGAGSSGDIVVTSPLQGYIKALNVTSGDYVETGAPIATVSQNRRLRLRAELSEKYFGKLGQIRDANFVTSYSDKVFRLKDLGGRLASYGRSSGGEFFIPVTFEFDNKGEFVPGSYVDVFLIASGSETCISVPVGAVVEDQGVHYVFVRSDDGDFIRREVTLGESDGERIPVRSGLKEGEDIVVEGAVYVKLAGAVSVPAGHTHNH